jgi:hypothetical protein
VLPRTLPGISALCGVLTVGSLMACTVSAVVDTLLATAWVKQRCQLSGAIVS